MSFQEACFVGNMHEFVHMLSIMSLHDMFKESSYWDNGSERPNCGVLGQFYSTAMQTMERTIPVQQSTLLWIRRSIRLLQILQNNDLTNFDIFFIQIGENDQDRERRRAWP